MDLPPDQPDKGTTRMRPLGLFMFVSMLRFSLCADLCVQLSYICIVDVWFCVCVPTGNPHTSMCYGVVTASPLSGH